MNQFKAFVSRISFKKKFLLSISVVILCMAATFYLMSYHIYRESKNLLYTQIHSNMSFSAEALKNNLDVIVQACDSISFDQDVYTSLKTASSEPNYTNYQHVISQLNSSVSLYADKLAPYHVPYLMIFNEYVCACSYYPAEKMAPPEIILELEKIAAEKQGGIAWITEYSSTYGIFLTRQIRRFTSQGFDSLATLVICINTEEMLETANTSLSRFNDVSYALMQDGEVLYKDLPSEELLERRPLSSDSYSVVSADGEAYFSSMDEIPSYGWEYYLYLPYNSVYRPLKALRIMTVVFLTVSITICFLLVWLLIYSMLRHLDILVNKIRLFSETQTLDTSHDYRRRKDEIGFLHTQFDQMAHNIQNLIKKNYTLEILRKDAEIKQLKAQINPHFLYNTLDSINWRAKASGDQIANTMVESLAALLRASMEPTSHITLKEEVTLVGHYLTIQRFRYSENLCYTLSIPPECENILIPPITLQPLVENAIRYSLEQEGELCAIEVSAALNGDILHLKVCNTGSQFENDLLQKLEEKTVLPHGMGVGLLNIHHRFQLIYGREYGLHLYNQDDCAVVEITFPARTA